VLDVKLKYIEKYILARQNAASYYDKNLKNIHGLAIPSRKNFSTHTFHQYTFQTEKRDLLQVFLKDKGIPSMIYYPMPLHLQKAYKFLGHYPGDYPVSEKLSETVLSLPMHTELNEKQLEYITESITCFFEKS
ncbi:MAG: DegT/DnrJ/EryC1/StrS family aminotransferase, partial [Prolixibacteraceae bacterium]|nr:DegT/DnrJ/EryC1/StrS family aminotransferase [Prolixibacteraceae bacterium]MBN2774084.1 DegT/DnrJ/EryC1/StrS family aminotransferase [Prolixibacteraceae bacterium]